MAKSIFTSSIGKKFIMSISGLFLIVFLCLHATINTFYIFNPDWFRQGCEFMSLPVVDIMVPILALGFVIHIAYGIILSIGNLKARGEARYAVANRAKADSWSAKNMIWLGLIVLGFIAFHLTHFWAKMQLQDWLGNFEANDPVLLMETVFKPVWVVALYIVWFFAIWMHLTHGFWSAFQTLGWNNAIWFKRVKVIGIIVVTVICLMLVAVAAVACLNANTGINFHLTEICNFIH